MSKPSRCSNCGGAGWYYEPCADMMYSRLTRCECTAVPWAQIDCLEPKKVIVKARTGKTGLAMRVFAEDIMRSMKNIHQITPDGEIVRPEKVKKKAKKPKKSALAKRKGNTNSKLWRNKADHAWSQIITSQGFCSVCGAGQVNAHHLITRRVTATRHSLLNGICLCAKHHQFDPKLSAHGSPLAFAVWLQENRPDQWQWIKDHRNDVCDTEKADFKERYKSLSVILEEVQKKAA